MPDSEILVSNNIPNWESWTIVYSESLLFDKKNDRCGFVEMSLYLILFLEYFNFNIYKHKFVLCFSRNLCKVFNKLPNLNLHLLSASIFEIIEITIVLEMGRCLM